MSRIKTTEIIEELEKTILRAMESSSDEELKILPELLKEYRALTGL